MTELTDGTHARPQYVSAGIPFLSVKDISSGKISFQNCRYITEADHDILSKRCNPQKGDILLTKVGTTGIPVLVQEDASFSLFVSVALLKYSQSFLNGEFLIYLLKSPVVQAQAEVNTRGVGNKNWVLKDIGRTLIPVPPFKEQHRIVEKLGVLMKEIGATR